MPIISMVVDVAGTRVKPPIKGYGIGIEGSTSGSIKLSAPTTGTDLTCTVTAAGLGLLGAADASAQRTALELGTAATTASTAYATAAQGAKADTALQNAAAFATAAQGTKADNAMPLVTFANDAARTGATPTAVGQRAIQLDTKVIYTATALTQGSWAVSSFPQGEFALTDNVSGTVAIDRSLGDVAFLDCGSAAASSTRALGNWSNAVGGEKMTIFVKQSSNGTCLVTFGTNYIGSSDLPLASIPFSTAASAVDSLIVQYSSTLGKFVVLAFTRGIA